jgi:WD40 repeat protein
VKQRLRPDLAAIFLAIVPLTAALVACNLSAPPATTDPNVPPTVESGTIVSVTSSAPTVPPQSATDNRLPIGTLVLTQLGKPIAQLPDRQTVTLAEERFGGRASPDGRYGIRFRPGANGTSDIQLIDYTVDAANQVKDVPQATGLSGPSIVWRENSTGFAFFNVPPPNNPKAANSAISLYDIGSNQTKQLVPAPREAGTVAVARAFSPDGKYLIYAVSNASAEGPGGPDSKFFLFDTSNNQSTPLPADTFGFNQWLKNSKGFLVTRSDPQGSSQVVIYSLAALNNPRILTPNNAYDFLVDASPDGKFIAVTSMPTGQANQPANIYIMQLDGTSRKKLTSFNTVDQTITALVWGSDGIYYSVTTADNTDATWRMDLDGANATQVAQGTLNDIVGAH